MPENPNPETRTDTDPEVPQTPPQPESEPTVPQEPQTPPPADPAEPPVDWREKFADSTRENQVLTGRIAELEKDKARRELTNEPTDPELQAAFPEWNVMTDTEKRLARESFTARRLASNLQQKEQEREAAARWNTDLELAIAKTPALQGKEQAFKTFAAKPTHRGAPIETLVSAFLYEASSAPSATPDPTPSAPGLEPGNGGPRVPEKPKVLSGSELKKLRETDEKRYREYVTTHDIPVD